MQKLERVKTIRPHMLKHPSAGWGRTERVARLRLPSCKHTKSFFGTKISITRPQFFLFKKQNKTLMWKRCHVNALRKENQTFLEESRELILRSDPDGSKEALRRCVGGRERTELPASEEAHPLVDPEKGL